MKKFLFSILSLTLALGVLIPLSIPALACNESRWTGGGSFFTADGMRVTHGFEIYADTAGPDSFVPIAGPNNLEVNWEGNHFHLLDLTYVSSYADKLGGPQPPPKTVENVLIGKGTGRYNGVDGAIINFVFTDRGEPGINDAVQMYIWDSGGNLVLSVDYATLQFGNHQSHLLTGNK